MLAVIYYFYAKIRMHTVETIKLVLLVMKILRETHFCEFYEFFIFFLRIRSHLLKKFLMENFIFYAASVFCFCMTLSLNDLIQLLLRR